MKITSKTNSFSSLSQAINSLHKLQNIKQLVAQDEDRSFDPTCYKTGLKTKTNKNTSRSTCGLAWCCPLAFFFFTGSSHSLSAKIHLKERHWYVHLSHFQACLQLDFTGTPRDREIFFFVAAFTWFPFMRLFRATALRWLVEAVYLWAKDFYQTCKSSCIVVIVIWRWHLYWKVERSVGNHWKSFSEGLKSLFRVS